MAPASQRQTEVPSTRRIWSRALLFFALPLCGRAWLIGQTRSAASPSAWQRTTRASKSTTTLCNSPSSSPDDEARVLQDKAARLRQEIAELERSKPSAPSASRSSLPAAKGVTMHGGVTNEPDPGKVLQKTMRRGYEAVVPVLLADGTVEEEEVEFVPFHKDGLSDIITVEANLPLGIVLGESEDYLGAISVDEVVLGGSGDRVGIKEGDLVRAFTACRMQMDQPAWQLMAGGIGIPKHFRFMYSADNRPFEEVMEAIGSNRMDPQGRPVLLVIERVDGD